MRVSGALRVGGADTVETSTGAAYARKIRETPPFMARFIACGSYVMSFRMLVLSASGALVCVVGAGCASEGPKPTDELTKAHTVIAQADKGGTAQRYAAADLQRAHDELSDADRYDAEKKYDEARAFAQRAEVDADVAVARGNSGEAQKAAQDVGQANNALQQETEHHDVTAPAGSGQN
jgi:Domain of unknown function (DUF4398)